MEKQNFIVFFKGQTQKGIEVSGSAISLCFPNRESFCKEIGKEYNIQNVNIINILRVSEDEVKMFCSINKTET